MFLLSHKQRPAGGGSFDHDLVEASCWLDGSADEITYAFPATQNQKAWTISVWFRRHRIGTGEYLWSVGTGSNRLYFYFNTDNTLLVQHSNGTNLTATSRRFVDAEWYHLRFVWDTDNATAADRMQVYINNERITFSADPSAGLTQGMNTSGQTLHIGRLIGSSGWMRASIAQFLFLSGDVSSTCGQSVTVGTNGSVWAPLSDTDAIALSDAAGSNSFALTSAIGDATDAGSRSNTLSAVSMSHAANGSTVTPSDSAPVIPPFCNFGGNIDEGGLKVSGGSGTRDIQPNWCLPKTGKWWWRATYTVHGDSWTGIRMVGKQDSGLYNEIYGIYTYTGQKVANAAHSGSYDSAWSNGDVVDWYFDADAGELYYARNNTMIGSADPDAGTNPCHTVDSDQLWAISHTGTGNSTIVYDFKLDGISRHADAQDYAPLCQANLPAATCQGVDKFSTILYTGDASSGQAQTGAGFQPGIVGAKTRNTGATWHWGDSNRGAGYEFSTDVNNAEGTGQTNGFQSFDSDGFTHGGDAGIGAANTHIAHCIKAGSGSTSSNTDGDITATVQADSDGTAAVVTCTGNSSGAQNIGHGLGVLPGCIWSKNRGNTSNVVAWFNQLGGAYLTINQQATSKTTSSNHYTGTNSTTVFQVGSDATVNGSTDMLHYVFGQVFGACWSGQYEGNGSAAGVHIQLNMDIETLIIINQTTGSHRQIYNRQQERGNPIDLNSLLNQDAAESTREDIDFVGGGFRIASNNAAINTDGQMYSFLALGRYTNETGGPAVPGQ